jgi:uncharacterized membrane protein HdeD (DUF308 family)
MSTNSTFSPTEKQHELQYCRKSWGWLLAWGALLLVAGTAAITYPLAATAIWVEVLGILLLLAAAFEFAAVFFVRQWRGVLATILCGTLSLFAGIVFLERPLLTAAGLTLFLAMMFLASGVVRIASALTHRFPGWAWTILAGAVDLLLAVLIWRSFPESKFWVIGMFVGIDMIFAGWSWVMLALELRGLPDTAHTPPPQAPTTVPHPG